MNPKNWYGLVVLANYEQVQKLWLPLWDTLSDSIIDLTHHTRYS